MGIDWEYILGADDYDFGDIGDIYEEAVYDAYERENRLERENDTRPSHRKRKVRNITWNGEEVTIGGEFGGHEFTDDEIAALSQGEYIQFTYKKDDKENTVVGSLAITEYKGNSALRFTPAYYVMNSSYVGSFVPDPSKKAVIPKAWNKHEFSRDEVLALLKGEEIAYSGITIKNNPASFNCKLKFAETDNGQNCRLVSKFANQDWKE